MRFWDSSAIVPLLLNEAHSEAASRLFAGDKNLVVWWGTSLECRSAIWSAYRRARVVESNAVRAETRLQEFRRSWTEVDPGNDVRSEAERALRIHDLRTTDALQLAAALVAQRQMSLSLRFVCLDQRLAQAAWREGFTVMAQPEDQP